MLRIDGAQEREQVATDARVAEQRLEPRPCPQHVATLGDRRHERAGRRPQPASADEIDALARATGAVALADARGAQWTKLPFNAATNPLAALTGLTHGELCDRPDLRAVVGELVAEGRRVADALGIALDADPTR